MTDYALSADDRVAVLADYDAILAEPPPPSNKTSIGCAMMVAGIVLFFIAPHVLPHSQDSALAFLLGDIALVLIGVLLWVFGGGGGFARTSMRVENALKVLSDTGAPADERRRAAVTLIACSVYSDSPSMTATFSPEAARQQIGASLPYVIAIERLLLAERHVYPVFTSRETESKTGG